MPIQLRQAYRPKRYSPRQTIEELPVLDARWLARKKLFPRDYSTRRFGMRAFNPVINWLNIGPRAVEVLFITGETQVILVNWLPIHGVCQSVRAAFQCPGCDRNAFKLYYDDGYFAACCHCIGAPYASQQRSCKNRSRLQAARLRMFLSSLPDDTNTPARQPFTSRRLYARYIARLRKLEAHRSRRQKPLTRKLSHKALRPLTAYDSERHALD
jgi:hypothetical protein